MVGEENKELINNWFDDSIGFYAAHGDITEDRVELTAQTNIAIQKVATSLRILCRSAWDKWLDTNKPEEGKERTK